MKTVLKVGGILLLVVILLLAGVLTYLKTALPDVGPPPEIAIEGNAEQLKRGAYLANHVMVCMDCHSKRDWTQFAGPPIESTFGMGGEVFDQKFGFPGKYVSSNITPANLSNWTDGEVFRAVVSGVGKDGRALFPVMPHHNYGKLDEKDIRAVIAYIRSIPAIENQTEASVPDFPLNFILNTIPKKANLQPMPSKAEKEKYGEYLVTAAACYDCHTNQEKGEFIGEPFAGGMRFPLPNNYTVVSTNITPHESGIGSWTEELFVKRFKLYADSTYTPEAVGDGDRQSAMPWTMYAGMSEEDLGAMYAYLKTVKPVDTSQ